MDFIVLPAQTLSDSNASPFVLGEETEHAVILRAEVFLGNHLEELLRQDNMSVFIFIVSISV